MIEFIKEDALNSAICELIKDAQKNLYLISPYIKLNNRVKDALRLKREDHNLSITVVFGKNENDASKSLSKESLDFFKEFPNIKICYKDTLHAKYYATEKQAIITSMNLYDYSQSNNIEVGILFDAPTVLKDIVNIAISDGSQKDVYTESVEYFKKNVIGTSKPIFHSEPKLEKHFLGKTSYLGQNIIVDDSESISRFSARKPQSTMDSKQGYCIRTGAPIPYNPEHPMSPEAYKKWAQFKNPDYPEKFCHKTGKPSDGKTTMRNPIL